MAEKMIVDLEMSNSPEDFTNHPMFKTLYKDWEKSLLTKEQYTEELIKVSKLYPEILDQLNS